MTTAEATTVNALIRERMADLNGSFPKREVAELVYGDLTDEQIRSAAIEGLIGRMRAITSQMRPPVRLSKLSPSSKWDAVREARDILDDFWVGFEDRPGKHLLDCTEVDCADAAEAFRYRAETNAARAASFNKLAAKLRKAKARVVADLDRDEVRRLVDA